MAIAIWRRARPFMELLSPSQLLCMTNFYMNKSTNSKPKIKITDWNAYFGVTHAKNGDPWGEISP